MTHLALPRLARLRPGPATHVAFGLVALMIALLLLSDLFVTGFLPDTRDPALRQRPLEAELVGRQVATALHDRKDGALRELLAAALRRDPTLRSAAIVAGGEVIAVAGDHAHQWHLAPDATSTPDNLRAVLLVDERPWGEVQLAYTPSRPRTLLDWLQAPFVRGSALMAGAGFVAFQLYLRRAMRYLDPRAAVPERVRTALDQLSEALLVLDPSGHIVLANRAFLALGPQHAASLIGTRIDELRWLVDAMPTDVRLPWQRVFDTGQPVLNLEARIGESGARRREVVVNCSPVTDGYRRARGCLVTLNDVTELHDRTQGLRLALAELHASREEIRQKNEELTLLATRDALTGSLNRRAFLAESERLIAAAQVEDKALCCIMCDVDHFKSINDRYGHAGGDEVLKSIVKALSRGLRNGDLLGRYGGEEFCILLPEANLEQALVIAERLRAEVEAHVGSAVRQFDNVKVTMSFGVEALSADLPTFAALVDRADQALYHSKETGRNRVTAWGRMPVS